jgi:hypothetical protein
MARRGAGTSTAVAPSDAPLPGTVMAAVGRQRVHFGPGATLALAFAVYLGLSVLLWWHVWFTHPTTVTLCGCEDPSLSVWFLEWPAYALAHGHNLFYSTSLFHPVGINLLANTGMLALGVPLAPVTWLFGPVATLNVALTLAPPLTAVSMYWLLRRWVDWAPAAFVGGLVFGFSPFVVDNLALAHLDLVALALVPLIVGALDELVVRQRRSPLVAGGALGLLVALQFFVSTEVVVIVVPFIAAGLALVVAYAAVWRRAELVDHAPHALRGVAVAVGLSAALLAYPVWFALDGPAHLSGLVWPPIGGKTAVAGAGSVVDLWRLRLMSPSALRFFAGYQGPALPEPGYLGISLLAVVGAGLLAFWRDARLWLLAVLGLLAAAFGLGRQHYWTLWRVLSHVPIVQNVVPVRFALVVTGCVAAMLALVVASARGWVGRALAARSQAMGREGARAWPAAVVALAVAALALVPLATAEVGNVPLTTQGVAVPRWFTTVGSRLPPGRVVLTFPPPVDGGSAMTWQAFDGLRFSLATGAGPESIPRRAGPERAGQGLLTDAASVFPVLASVDAAHVSAVRRALAGWEVTDVVVPAPDELVPPADRDAATAWALGIFTLAVGRPPRFADGAWVWATARSPAARRSVTAAAFAACTAVSPGASLRTVPHCVMSASRPR